MNIDKLLPYRLTMKEIENLAFDLNDKLINSVPDVKEISTDYIKLNKNIRYAFQTFHGEKIHCLRSLKQGLIDFTDKLISRLNREETLYIRKHISYYYISPSHIDPCTFDFIEHPTKGCWIPYCRIRQLDHEIKSISTSDTKRLIK